MGGRGRMEEAGDLAKLHPQAPDDWLPITQSRQGNSYYSAFHILTSGIDFQALSRSWGSICLWLLIHLHESQPGVRHSRYLPLAMVAFGEKVGKGVALLPIMYLSGGTCVTLVVIGAAAMRAFFQTVAHKGNALTTMEWYFLFTAMATLLAQLPNLNSLAPVSLLGALTVIASCTLLLALSLIQGRILPLPPSSQQSLPSKVLAVFNAFGIIAFTFKGHNLVLEIQVIQIHNHSMFHPCSFIEKLIQGTLPSDAGRPSHLAMWRGVKFAYLIIASCLFPLTIGGYWAYGNLVTSLPITIN